MTKQSGSSYKGGGGKGDNSGGGINMSKLYVVGRA